MCVKGGEGLVAYVQGPAYHRCHHALKGTPFTTGGEGNRHGATSEDEESGLSILNLNRTL